MERLRRRRSDEASDEFRASAPHTDASMAPRAEALLDLQARAGNRAVTELVGTQAAGAARPSVQRDGADATPTATPVDDRGASPRVNTMSIPELKLAVPVQSVQGLNRRPRGRDGRGGDPETAVGDVTVTFAAEDMTPKLWEAMAKGRTFGTITITIGAATITLHGVILSAAQMGKDTASLTLNFTSMELDPGPQPPSGPNDWGE